MKVLVSNNWLKVNFSIVSDLVLHFDFSDNYEKVPRCVIQGLGAGIDVMRRDAQKTLVSDLSLKS